VLSANELNELQNAKNFHNLPMSGELWFELLTNPMRL
jgi:hypothetical protein